MTIDEKDDTKIDGEESDGLERLIDDGNKPDEKVETKDDKDEKTDGEDEGEEEGADEEEDSGLEEIRAQLSTLSEKVDEKDAEITFLRGELAKKTKPETKDEVDEINMDDLVAKLTDKNPKTAAQAIIELANKIADKKIAAVKTDTTNLLTQNSQVQAAKETDRNATFADFGDYLEDPKFTELMTKEFQKVTRAAGGRYVPDSLYSAAAVAKIAIDKARANGKGKIKEIKTAPKNPVDQDTNDYSKAVTIDGIPDNVLSPRQKAAAKGVVRKMKIDEKDWVKNFIEQENA
jgi:hypothetical protein